MAIVVGAVLQTFISNTQAQGALIKLQKDYGNQSSVEGKRKVLAEYVEKSENHWKPILNLNVGFFETLAQQQLDDNPTYNEWCDALLDLVLEGDTVAMGVFYASGCDL